VANYNSENKHNDCETVAVLPCVMWSLIWILQEIPHQMSFVAE